MPREKGRRVVASNRKARHEYAILSTYEAGIALMGTEVKSLRAGRCSLVDSFAQEKDGELYLYGLHISRSTPTAPGQTTSRGAPGSCCSTG